MTQDLQPAGAPLPEPGLVPPVPPSLSPLPTPTGTADTPAPFSLLALFALIGGLAGPILTCIGSVLVAVQTRGTDQGPMLVSLILVSGLIGLPLAWYARIRLQGRYGPRWQPGWVWAAAGVVGLIVFLGLGELFVYFKWAPEYALAIIQPLIFLAGVGLLLGLVASGGAGLSRLRAWGHFMSGAWLSVGLAIVAEVIVVVILAIIIFAVLASVDPAQAQELIRLLRSARNGFDEQALTGLLLRPWVIVTAYLVVSLLIPMIEEALKPIGVVILIGQKPAPAAAFMGGLLGGLGFAVLESLSNLVNIQDPWIVLVVARLGTLVMHGFTSALVGWGWGQLAQGKPLRLLLAYFGAVTLHGLWNGAVVTFVFAGTGLTNNPASAGLNALLVLGVLMIIVSAITCVVGLLWAGYRNRSRAIVPYPV